MTVHIDIAVILHIQSVHDFGTYLDSFKKLCSSLEHTPCPEKKRPRYFQLQLSHSLVDFYNFYTVGNRNEHSTVTCNIVT